MDLNFEQMGLYFKQAKQWRDENREVTLQQFQQVDLKFQIN